MRRRLLALGAALALLSPTGCISGALYRHTTMPLDVNFDATPAHSGRRATSRKTLVIPWPVRMQFDWGSTAVGDAMREQGITKAHYADLETFSVAGLWTQRWIHVYGE